MSKKLSIPEIANLLQQAHGLMESRPPYDPNKFSNSAHFEEGRKAHVLVKKALTELMPYALNGLEKYYNHVSRDAREAMPDV